MRACYARSRSSSLRRRSRSRSLLHDSFECATGRSKLTRSQQIRTPLNVYLSAPRSVYYRLAHDFPAIRWRMRFPGSTKKLRPSRYRYRRVMMARADEKREADNNHELCEQLYGTFCAREHMTRAMGRGEVMLPEMTLWWSPFPKCKGALLFTHLHVSLPFFSMTWARAACACMRIGSARSGERVSWGFVYDFVRCSFDALFSPIMSSLLARH
jgi:hypothetical protein